MLIVLHYFKEDVNEITTGLEAHQILISSSVGIMLKYKAHSTNFCNIHNNMSETNIRVKITLYHPEPN